MTWTIVNDMRNNLRIIKSICAFTHDATTDEAFERAKFAVIFRRDKADGVTDRVRPARPTDAMDVILDVHGEIIVHHVRNAVHINAARGDVGRDQHAHRAGFEIFQRPQALVLRTVGMQCGGLDAVVLKLLREPVGGVLHARKDEHHIHGGFLQEMDEQRGLQRFRHFIDKLRHGLGGI